MMATDQPRLRKNDRTLIMRRIDQARKLHAEGIDFRTIAARTGLSPYVLTRALHADALRVIIIRESAAERRKSFAAKVARRNVPDIEALDAALRGGQSNAHIARTLRIKYTLVARRRMELGLPPVRLGKPKRNSQLPLDAIFQSGKLSKSASTQRQEERA